MTPQPKAGQRDPKRNNGRPVTTPPQTSTPGSARRDYLLEQARENTARYRSK